MRLLVFCAVLLLPSFAQSQHRDHPRHEDRRARRSRHRHRPDTVAPSADAPQAANAPIAVTPPDDTAANQATPDEPPAVPTSSAASPLANFAVPDTPLPARWIEQQPEVAWHYTRDANLGSGFNAPGLFFLPELEVSFLLDDDPLGYRRLGFAPVAVIPITTRFRFGWSIGALTLSVAARFSFMMASQQQLPYEGQAWNGGAEVGGRYTFLSGGPFQPFLSASGGILFWGLPLTVGSSANAERVNGAATVVARGGVGLSIRLVRWLYLDITGSVEWMSGNSLQTGSSVLSGDQIAIVPSLGLSHYISAR